MLLQKKAFPQLLSVAISLLGVAGLASLAYSDYSQLNRQPLTLAGKTPSKVIIHPETDENTFTSIDKLFGEPKKEGPAPIPSDLPETRLKLTLRGTFTHREDARQSALISSDKGKSIRYYTGDEISPGTKIVAIEAGMVTLRRNGQDEVLKLPLLSDSQEREQHRPQRRAGIQPSRAIQTINPAGQSVELENERREKLKERLEKLRKQAQQE